MDNDFRFVLHETPLDSYLAKSGPHKYISKKMVRGKWVYEYKDDVVKRVVDLLLDFLSNPARSATLGQVARSFRVNNVMAKEVVDSLVAQKRIELVPGERGVPTYRQATPKEAKPKPVVREPVVPVEKEKKASFARYQDQVMERLKAEPDGWLYYRGATRDLPLDGYEANKLIDALVDQGLVTKESKAFSSGTIETIIRLTAKGGGKKEEPKEPPKVLIEPPKKTKKELQAQKKELQREANKIHGAGGQLSLDFTVKLEMIDDKISDADINENVEKVVEEIQKPVAQPEPKPLVVDGRPDEEFTREFGEHVWGSKADKWAILTVSDNLAEFPPAEQAKLCTKKRLMTDASPEELLDSGVTPGGVLMRKVVERCVQAKAGDSLRARKAYMDGITFLDRSLAQCITAQDVHDFIQEWHYLAQGKKKLVSYSRDEIEVLQVTKAKQLGRLFSSVSVARYIAERKKHSKAETDHLKAMQLVFLRKHVSKKIDKKLLAEAEAGEARAKAILDEAEREFDKVGGKHVMAGIHARNTVEEKHGAWNLAYELHNGKYTFYEKDPDLSRDIKENPYTLFAAALGPRIARLVGSNAGYKAPKIYKDAETEINSWRHYDPEKTLNDEAREERVFQFLEPKKRGDGKSRFRWKREVSENVERVGGQAVKEAPTVVEFAETFGLPNVQMGNWVKSDIESAKSHLEGAQGALLDLSEIMGIDPKTVGLNGRLSLSFGGRGGGTAKAHYEPSKVIINLTKFAGGGSLAHEWAHAFDNLIPRSHNKKDTSAMPMISDGAHEGIPAKIKDAYNEVMGAIRYAAKDESKAKLLGEGVALERQVLKTRVVSEEYRKKMPLYRQAQKEVEASNYFLDSATVGGSENSYWTRGHEMFARAFESYIEDTLTDKKRKSSYLASGTQKHYNTGKIRTVEGKQIEAQVYPQGEERKRINKAMAKLVRALAEEKALEKSLRLLDEQFFIKAG